MKTYILASKNAHKAKEIKDILGDDFHIMTQTEAGAGDIEVVEDGKTFEENAIKKAQAILQATGKPTIADDSGLCVDVLGGAPGVYTARYAGEHATDAENIQKLLLALSDVPLQDRTAHFACVIAVAEPGQKIRTFYGECSGRIALTPSGEDGFGYDPVFYYPRYDKTLAELPPYVKNTISHRSAALQLAAEDIKNR